MVNPRDLITKDTFDVMAKLIYARAYINRYQTAWPEQLYVQHLKVWNGLYEHTPRKTCAADYINAFQKILNDVEWGRFDFSKSPVFTHKGKVINGRHRLTAGIAHWKDVDTQEVHWSAGQEVCDYMYLRTKRDKVEEGLTDEYLSPMAYEYIKLKNTTRILTVFRPHNSEEIKGILNKYGDVVYHRIIRLANFAPWYLMRELYFGEPWLMGPHVDPMKSFSGAWDKARLCYPAGTPLTVGIYLIDTKEPEGLKDCKEKIRAIFGVGKHSAHINDTWDETIRIGKLLLNDNGIHFINHAHPSYFEKFHGLVEKYQQFRSIDSRDQFGDHFCIDGSSVMSLYGIRPARDLDYLHDGMDLLGAPHQDINSHLEELSHYQLHLHDIMYNVRNHFWFNGIKYASLDTVRRMKSNRHEEKDIADVNLIDMFLKTKGGM